MVETIGIIIIIQLLLMGGIFYLGFRSLNDMSEWGFKLFALIKVIEQSITAVNTNANALGQALVTIDQTATEITPVMKDLTIAIEEAIKVIPGELHLDLLKNQPITAAATPSDMEEVKFNHGRHKWE